MSDKSTLTSEEALRDYDELARRFVAKVESGEARSEQTYKELKRLLARRPTS